jgi:hypothetical protein
MWTPVVPKHETWACPRCGRDVEIPSSSPPMARNQGMWLPPGEIEIVSACERAHGAHLRPEPS